MTNEISDKSALLARIAKRYGKTSWNTGNLTFDTYSTDAFSVAEQEITCSSMRDSDKLYICASDTTWITKLRKNPNFHVTELLVSEEDHTKILQVRGWIHSDGLTIRKSIKAAGESS